MSKDISVLLGKVNIENGIGKNSIQQISSNENIVKGDTSAVFGSRNNSAGNNAFVAGYNNTIASEAGVALGANNTSSYNQTVLIGYNLKTSSSYQIVLGTSLPSVQPRKESFLSILAQTGGEVFWVDKSTGDIHITTNLHTTQFYATSIVVGDGCEVRNQNSIAAGSYCVTRLKNNFAFGSSLDTGSDSSVWSKTIVGFLNKSEVGDVFQVGIGTIAEGRKNGFRVLFDGRAKVASAPVDGDDVVRKDDLSSPNMFKTLFGNQNIVGQGNIDLFKHSIKGVLGNSTFYLRIYSSNNLQANSLTDLKTLLGDTFEESVTGSNGIMAITNEKVLYGDGTDASIAGYTITDKVTTI